MSEWTVKAENGNERTVESRSEAEETKAEMEELGLSCQIHPPDGETDGGTQADGPQEIPMDGVEAEVIDHTEASDEAVEQAANSTESMSDDHGEDGLEAIDQLGESLETDPLSILPGHMTDRIQGQPAVNKRGYAMIAERYGIEVSADIVVYPWENDENRCVARATAETENGREYSGWATASAEDDDMEDQIIELAETRSLKRAVSWASGVGIVSYQELVGELE